MQLLVHEFKTKKIKFLAIENFIYRASFQIIYTLACLYKNEKNFTHNDFFLRNILGTYETSYGNNDYVEYKIFNKSFYLSANGFYSKINDFGFTVIYPTIKPNFVDETSGPLSRQPWKKDDEKSDIYNFFYDFYNGENLGAFSTMRIFVDNRMPKVYIRKLQKIFNNFIKIKELSKMMNVDLRRMDGMWNISDYKFMQKLVKTPKEYIKSEVFKRYSKLPKGSRIVQTYSC
ncbi:MAG: hypothetical protein GTN36_05035 [Candidatus Aenigmarchaeota archaeon]|nr:hypothetical protein [Candidatus Aenigmarchaeota archaeon]